MQKQVFYLVWGEHNGEKINFAVFTSEEKAKESMQRAIMQGYFQTVWYEKQLGYECEQCGDMIESFDDMEEVNEGYICRECFEEHYYRCDYCDEYFHEDDIYFTDYSEYACNDCFREHFTHCAHCDTVLYLDDSTYVDNVGHVCDSCFYDNYAVCDGCCEIYPYGEIDYYEHHGRYFCHDCAPHGIRPYGYKPEPNFHHMSYEDKPLYLGVELEVDNGGEDNNNACRLLDMVNEYTDSHMYIKHDGSLDNGFELVTHPLSYEYHIHAFPWQELLQELKNMGYRSHDTETCGLHIHIDREYLGENREERDKNIVKILMLVEYLNEQMKIFARRDGVKWCKYIRDKYVVKGHRELYRYARTLDSRYYAVNLTNSKTIELRLFKGTLNKNTLLATIQFVKYLVEYALTHSLEEIEDITWEKFIYYANDVQFPYLVNYLKKRELWIEQREEQTV